MLRDCILKIGIVYMQLLRCKFDYADRLVSKICKMFCITKVIVVVSYACDQNHKVTCYGLKVIAKYLCFKKCTEAYRQQIEEM